MYVCPYVVQMILNIRIDYMNIGVCVCVTAGIALRFMRVLNLTWQMPSLRPRYRGGKIEEEKLKRKNFLILFYFFNRVFKQRI